MKAVPPSREEVYSKLAQVFKYTPDEIANMTPYQQIALYSPESVAETLMFDTEEEFLAWQRKNWHA